MQAAHHARAAAGERVHLILGLERHPALGCDPVEVERFGEGAAEVLPHPGGEFLPLGLRHPGIGEGEVAHDAFLPVEMRGDQAPRQPRRPGGDLHRQRARYAFGKAKADVFQPVAQFC